MKQIFTAAIVILLASMTTSCVSTQSARNHEAALQREALSKALVQHKLNMERTLVEIELICSISSDSNAPMRFEKIKSQLTEDMSKADRMLKKVQKLDCTDISGAPYVLQSIENNIHDAEQSSAHEYKRVRNKRKEMQKRLVEKKV